MLRSFNGQNNSLSVGQCVSSFFYYYCLFCFRFVLEGWGSRDSIIAVNVLLMHCMLVYETVPCGPITPSSSIERYVAITSAVVSRPSNVGDLSFGGV